MKIVYLQNLITLIENRKKENDVISWYNTSNIWNLCVDETTSITDANVITANKELEWFCVTTTRRSREERKFKLQLVSSRNLKIPITLSVSTMSLSIFSISDVWRFRESCSIMSYMIPPWSMTTRWPWPSKIFFSTDLRRSFHTIKYQQQSFFSIRYSFQWRLHLDERTYIP